MVVVVVVVKNVKFVDNNNNLGSISENSVNDKRSNGGVSSSLLKQGSVKMGRLTKWGAGTKSSKHVSWQWIAVMNQAQSIVKLEEFGNGLKDVIWNEANVMDGKAGYRMYIWKHMAKNVWLPIDVMLFFNTLEGSATNRSQKKKKTKKKRKHKNVSQQWQWDDSLGGGSQITRNREMDVWLVVV